MCRLTICSVLMTACAVLALPSSLQAQGGFSTDGSVLTNLTTPPQQKSGFGRNYPHSAPPQATAAHYAPQPNKAAMHSAAHASAMEPANTYPPRAYSNRDAMVTEDAFPDGRISQEELSDRHRASFLDNAQRAQAEGEAGNSLWDQVTKIALNLVIVLMLATGVMVGLKHYQKHGGFMPKQTEEDVLKSEVIDVVRVDRQTSITLQQVRGHQVLVTKDTAGTKAVNVLPISFSSSLDDVGENEVAPAQAAKPDSAEESMSDIDERLVKLFVNRSKKAA